MHRGLFLTSFPYLRRPFTSSSMVTAGMKRNNITGLVKKRDYETYIPTTQTQTQNRSRFS